MHTHTRRRSHTRRANLHHAYAWRIRHHHHSSFPSSRSREAGSVMSAGGGASLSVVGDCCEISAWRESNNDRVLPSPSTNTSPWAHVRPPSTIPNSHVPCVLGLPRRERLPQRPFLRRGQRLPSPSPRSVGGCVLLFVFMYVYGIWNHLSNECHIHPQIHT